MSERIRKQFEWQIFTRKDDGQEDLYARTLHLSKRMGENEKTQNFINDVSQIEGVEGVQPQGPYALSLFIGRCFNVDVVVTDIETKAKAFLSDLVIPVKSVQLVT